MKLFGRDSGTREGEGRSDGGGRAYPGTSPRERGGGRRDVYLDHQGRVRERHSPRAGPRQYEHGKAAAGIEPEDKEAPKSSWKAQLLGLARDVAIAFIIMLIILGSMFAYTGNWPPVVVVQSPSMMHGDDSEIGVIDTGDLVLVKKVVSRSDITTYYDGKADDYMTYDQYGDVIIYYKNGDKSQTPVIHRVLFWLEFDKVATDSDHTMPKRGHFNIPELKMTNLTGTVVIDNKFPAYFEGEHDGPLTINLNTIYTRMSRDPHSGYITKGDNNPIDSIDQYSESTPVKFEWVIGKAKGEMPWFGLIKLYISKTMVGSPPRTSVNMLIFTIALLIIVPICIELAYNEYLKRKERRSKEEKEMDARQDKGRIEPRNQYGGRKG